VDHRHLLPSEIDLLLDGDAGFGLAPLRAHVRRCAHCQGELEAARRIVELLDDLPHFAPSVMARVQLFEPWHVTLRDSVRGLAPASRPARVLAAAGAFTTALVVSVAAIALLGRMDVLVFGWQLATDRARAALVGLFGDAVAAVFGDVAVGALARSGPGAIAMAMLGFLGSVVLAVLLLRALTAAYHRQRS
jgi:hypothetical protein